MNILQEARTRVNLSRPQMSQRLNVSVQTIYQYETGRRLISASELLKVAKQYYLREEEIITYLKQVSK
ncbi:MAG: helix-turn-helix transcriptional regulator [Sarcina sp.]